MQIYLAADHRGFKLKEALKPILLASGYEVLDVGNDHYDEADDYPDFVFIAASAVAKDSDNKKAIVFCGSGAGADIAANKIKGIRAAIAINKEQAAASRREDDTNILALAADYISEKDAEEIALTWLKASFSGEERYSRRIKKIADMENRLNENNSDN